MKRCRCLRCDVKRRRELSALKRSEPCHRRSYRFESMESWSARSEGQTILQAAKANGKYIPTLC